MDIWGGRSQQKKQQILKLWGHVFLYVQGRVEWLDWRGKGGKEEKAECGGGIDRVEHYEDLELT